MSVTLRVLDVADAELRAYREDRRHTCAYCQKAPASKGYDRCRDCRTWRDEEWCEAHGVEHGVAEPCGACGAEPGEPCREHCTARP